MVHDTKLYDVLEIAPDAPEQDVKRAYKRAALKFHPDKNKDNPEAEQRFKDATDAYSVLSDPDRRRLYDQHGVTSTDGQPPQPPPDLSEILNNIFGGGGGGGFPGGGPFGFPFGGGGGHATFSFGGGGGGGHQQVVVSRANVPITLADMYNGGPKLVNMELVDACAKCAGKGVENPERDILTCMACGGRGRTISQIGQFVTQVNCGSCQGRGSMVKPGRGCAACGGGKVARTSKTFEVKLPRGVPHGHKHTLAGKGEFSAEHGKNYDLELSFLHQLPPGIAVDDAGETVRVDVRVELAELLGGFSRTLELWAPIRVVTQGYVDPCKTYGFEGKGLPRFGRPGFGTLEVRLDVAYPSKDSFAKYAPVFQRVFPPPTPTEADSAGDGGGGGGGDEALVIC